MEFVSGDESERRVFAFIFSARSVVIKLSIGLAAVSRDA
jgi:hypothetical protein